MAWWQRQHGESTRGRIVALLRRGEQSVEELAQALGVTDNAVRAQLAILEDEGIACATGVRRSGTVGKPATLYGMATSSSPLFSSAYAPVLSSLLTELSARLPARQLDAALRAAGRRLAPAVPATASFAERVRTGAGVLIQLGADADLVETPAGYEIRGHGCVLSEAVLACPASCRAVEAMLRKVIGTSVHERCDRSGAPSCRFVIAAPA